MRPGLIDKVSGRFGGPAIRWRDGLQLKGADVRASFESGSAAFTVAGKHHYLAS